MRIVGLTGTMGSGKSAILQMLREMGARVYDCDQIARELSEPGQPLFREIVTEFGQTVVAGDGRLDRPKLREMIFSNPDDLRRMNDATREVLIDEIISRLMPLREKGTVVVEAIRLYETGIHRICDEVWYVDCCREAQIERIQRRNQWSREQALAALQSQKNVAEMRDRADRIIDNSGSLEQTRRQIETLYREDE